MNPWMNPCATDVVIVRSDRMMPLVVCLFPVFSRRFLLPSAFLFFGAAHNATPRSTELNQVNGGHIFPAASSIGALPSETVNA